MKLSKYIENKRILFARILDLPFYEGSKSDFETIIKEEVSLEVNGVNEIENFLNRDGQVYGFVEAGYSNNSPNNINIDKIMNNPRNSNFIDDCLIVFVGLKTSRLIGYYENAKIYRNRQISQSVFAKLDKLKEIEKFNYSENTNVMYYFKTNYTNAVLFDYNERIKIETGNNGLNFGQSNVKYLDKSNEKYAIELIYSLINKQELRGNEKAMDKINEIKRNLIKNHNIILRGAPGTGKTYLAKRVAASVIGIPFEKLEESNQYAFVQFHPSYDYTDFVEGLRPTLIDGNPSFEIKKGIFYTFCDEAKSNLNYQDNLDDLKNYFDEVTVPEITQYRADKYFRYIKLLLGMEQAKINGIENMPTYSSLEDILNNYEEIKIFDEKYKHKSEFASAVNKHLRNYLDIYKKQQKKFVFIIDEINRGEISRIFGELFFSIDPDYRGINGSIYTQYSNLEIYNEKFYVPENVYIIGTMNDIDRSVDTFDFAMRRRFVFEELTAEYSQIMLHDDNVKNRMYRLNQAIVNPNIGKLSSDYQIGGSYFLQLDKGEITSKELWDTRLEPLFKDYFRGNINANDIISELKEHYNNELDIIEDELNIER